MATPDEIDATVDRVAIDALVRAYADAVSRRAWDDVAALFLPDATVDLDLVDRDPIHLAGPDAFVAFVAPAVERFSFFEFVPLNTHIDLWPGGERSAASARVWMCELRVPAGGTGRDDAYGLYRDAYRKEAGTWRIAARRYRSLASFPAGVVHPFPADL